MSSPPPIRSKILRILLVPLVSLIGLWGFVAYSTVAPIVGIAQTQDRWQEVGDPARQLIVEFQRERQLSAQVAGRTSVDKSLEAQRIVTDRAAARLRELVGSINLQAKAGGTPADVQLLLKALDGLGELRASADSGKASPLQVTETYNALISASNRQFGNSSALTDVSFYRVLHGLTAYATSAEFLYREHAVLTAVLARGEMTSAERTAFVAAMTSRRIYMTSAERDIGPDLLAHYRELVGSAVYQRFQAAEDRIFAWDTAGAIPVDATLWKQDAGSVLGTLDRDGQRDLLRAMAKGDDLKSAAFWQIVLVLGLGLLIVVVSILVSYRFGRSMIRELLRLQSAAVELAEERLPRLVERLRKGDDVDAVAETPELEVSETAEVDRVMRALSTVRRTAVEAAVGQATLRKGVGQVFLNLAWRNQALLHRQLTLLDAMERRAEEPEMLEDLFRLDHLTTRMRRHAENLIILSDAAPGRRWRDPVPLFDLVRSSVLEVEDYTRVTVLAMPHAPLLVGSAATDVIHLIAELVENATVFSPPNTVVHVRGMTAANGFAVEVEDRGLGLSQSVIDEINVQLSEPPEFDLADTDRLGLFVVARLAARHGIKVVLRTSPYDGVTAIVLLPPNLLAVPESPLIGTRMGGAEQPSLSGQATGAARTGRAVRALGAAPEPWSRPASVPQAQPVAHGGDSLPSRFPAQQQSEYIPPKSSPQHQAFSASDADDDLDGLPMRVRQASIVPQLREPCPPEQRDVSTRSPEEIFDRMSSMQQGWQQGRSRAEQGLDTWTGKEGHSDGRPQI
ncbi:Signal transduction histidine kinase [Streptosporangium subroseum]|uniref:histidine kinase n=1 Tax=Streptosporangium subroseum TaxID=106412 RepID=A0A239L219_9ACTN|nr:nitrate- and nitrite sensing domain-containing protein [Streptosporangium subroseum]SNT24350.1 Signal transduction histidine kinase [Streptosporangium subroseum]